jgi:exodeoxyribonuclease VII small subunit
MSAPKPKAKGKSSSADELSFEQAYQELEDLVRQLEVGALALDESLTLFERGRALAARCQSLLDTAELKIQTLTPSGAQPFEGAED